jgi:type IV pilus assembly protein PilE
MRSKSGFTLIELMFVVAVVAILSAMAYGAYSENVISSKRTDGRLSLQRIATTLDKCKNFYGSYNSANCSIANASTVPSIDGYYDIQVTSAASTFTLKAVPAAGSPQAKDTYCTSMSLDNLGLRTGTGSDPGDCW